MYYLVLVNMMLKTLAFEHVSQPLGVRGSSKSKKILGPGHVPGVPLGYDGPGAV